MNKKPKKPKKTRPAKASINELDFSNILQLNESLNPLKA